MIRCKKHGWVFGNYCKRCLAEEERITTPSQSTFREDSSLEDAIIFSSVANMASSHSNYDEPIHSHHETSFFESGESGGGGASGSFDSGSSSSYESSSSDSYSSDSSSSSSCDCGGSCGCD